jgi:hypothetical protein
MQRVKIILIYVVIVIVLLVSSCQSKLNNCEQSINLIDTNQNTDISRKKTNRTSMKEGIKGKTHITNNHVTDNELIVTIDQKLEELNICEDKNTSKQTKYEIIDKNTYPEYLYYSPNGLNYIRVHFDFKEGEEGTKKFYLNQTAQLIDEVDSANVFSRHNPIYWISNDEVIITGRYIYNIKSQVKKQLNIDEFYNTPENERRLEYGGLNYSLNGSKTLMAYSFYKEDIMEIYIYNIMSNEYFKIDEEIIFERPLSSVFWDKNNNLYVNTFGESGHEIKKYNINNNKSNIFREGYWIDSMLPDSNYCMISDINNVTEIIELKNNTVLNSIPNKDRYTWYDNGNNIIFYNNRNNIISVYEYNNNKIKDIKEIRKNSLGVTIDYIEGTYIIFIFDKFIGKQYSIIQENTSWKTKYYSPNKKNYIEQEIITDYNNVYDSYNNNIYLNGNNLIDNIDIYSELTAQRINHLVEWIDNDKVIVNGSYIYNILTNEREEIDFNGLINGKDIKYVKSFSVNVKKHKIVFVTSEKQQRIILYDLMTKELKVLKTIDESTSLESPIDEIYWGKNNNIYINVLGLTIENNEILNTKMFEYYIWKYDIENNQINIYKEGAKICKYIKQLDYFIIETNDEEFSHQIINEKNNVIFKFNCLSSDFILKSIDFSWDESIFVFYDKTMNIKVYSFDENDIIFKNDLSRLLHKGYLINFIDICNNKIYFYVYNDILESNSGKIYSIDFR